MKGVSSERPERQLNDIVIEFDRRVLKIVQAVDDQHGNKRASRADERSRGSPDRRKGYDHRDLRQRVIRGVRAEQPIHDLDQPPRQRRQLVVADLPFAAIGERLDEIERQVGIEECGQRGPDDEMQGQEAAESGPRPALDPTDQSGRGPFLGRCRRHGIRSDLGILTLKRREKNRAIDQRPRVTSSGWGRRFARRISHNTPTVSNMPTHSRFHRP